MALTNEQIERYSRQIIVAGIGGFAQERLLTSRLMLSGKMVDIAPVLAYMVGAGVGRIDLRVSDGNAETCGKLLERMRDLNSGVTVAIVTDGRSEPDLIFELAGDTGEIERIRALSRQSRAPLVLTRLDTPARIAIFPRRPPCPVCASPDILVPFTRRADNAGFVAMVAAATAFRMIAQDRAVEQPMLIEFNGYETIAGEIRIQNGEQCGCGHSSTNPR